MDDLTLPLSGLSPVAGRPVKACFDGGTLSSDAGVLVLREVEGRLGVAERLARCLDDRRDPALITHSASDMIRFRMLMIAAGYEDGNDAASLRQDPVFKMAQGIAPSGRHLASQPTISRLENMADVRSLLRMAGAMVDLYCTSFRQVPQRIVLDMDDTFDAVHGGQQLRLFNAHHDEYGFQPIVVFDGEGRFVAAVLRPARRPKGVEIRGHLRRLVRAIRTHWPRVEILIRADGHYGVPEVIDLCRTMDVRFVLGAPTSARLRKHVVGLEAQVAARYVAKPGTDKVRRFTDFYDGAGSWSRTERIIARVETGPQGTDTRFIVTDLTGRSKALYEKVYCRRGTAENHIKAWKTHLAADRTSCTRAVANQFRLFLHAGAYWLVWGLRSAMPKRSAWRVAQFDTLRVRLIKIAARVVEMRTQIRVHLPTASPAQAILRHVLGRIPRLAT